MSNTDWVVPIDSKILREIDLFVWDFDLSLTKLHTIGRNDCVLKRSSKESKKPLLYSEISNPNSEWYAGKWLLNPEYFARVAKTLVEVHQKKIAIATHHSYKYFEDDRKRTRDGLTKSANEMCLQENGEFLYNDLKTGLNTELQTGLQTELNTDRLIAGEDLVIEYLRVAFQLINEDVDKYFTRSNIMAIDNISSPGKMEHILKILDGYNLRDSQGKINESLVSEIKADGRRYLRIAMFDDDPENIYAINRSARKYVKPIEVKNPNDSVSSSVSSDGSRTLKYDDISIRGIVLPTARGGIYCDEALWLRGFMAFPPSQIKSMGFNEDRMQHLKAILESEDRETSSNGEFTDDGYD